MSCLKNLKYVGPSVAFEDGRFWTTCAECGEDIPREEDVELTEAARLEEADNLKSALSGEPVFCSGECEHQYKLDQWAEDFLIGKETPVNPF